MDMSAVVDATLADRITALEQQVARLAAERDEAIRQRDDLSKLYEVARVQLEKLKRNLFGRKAERVDPAQAQLAFDLVMQALNVLGPAAPATEPETEQGETPTGAEPPASPTTDGDDKRERAGHGRGKLPAHLPVEVIEMLPPEVIAQGAENFERIGQEERETLEWRAGSWIRLRLVRPKFVQRSRNGQPVSEPVCEGRPELAMQPAPVRVFMADLPDEPFARCLAAPGLLARVLVGKFADSLPLHRQEKIYAREGIAIARSTLCGWVEGCAGALSPIVEAMAQDARKAAWIGIDATGVLVLQKEQCRRGHFWVLVAERDHVLFRYTPKHNQDGPKAFLGGYEGFVQADAALVYEALYRENPAITEVACWSHCRRYFFDALSTDRQRALAGIGFINKLFEIDRELKDLPPSRKLALRQQRAGPVVDAFEAWVAEHTDQVLPKSPIAQAFGYATNQRTALRRFLQDARLRLDNNLSELELRRQAVGRKNWIFCGSDDGAEWNATIVSLIASCQLHGLDPYAYLRDVLTVVGGWPHKRVLELAPKFWKATREQLVRDGKLPNNAAVV